MWLGRLGQVGIGILGREAASGLRATRVDLEVPARAAWNADIVVPVNDYRVALD
jgi:hypothetical protein